MMHTFFVKIRFIFFGSKRCLFHDRFDVGQCYNCQLLGHNSQNCMGNHRSSSCTLKNQVDKHCCTKCHNSTEGNDVASYQSHNSASLIAPYMSGNVQDLPKSQISCQKT